MKNTDLIRRLEAGETGREIDAEIAASLRLGRFPERYADIPAVPRQLRFAGATDWYITLLGKDIDASPEELAVYVAHYSTSLDAAVALVERVRPGQPIVIETSVSDHSPTGDGSDLRIGRWHIELGWKDFCASAPTPAAALIAALLRSQDSEP